MKIGITLDQFYCVAEVLRLLAEGYTIRVFHGPVHQFTLTPASRREVPLVERDRAEGR